MPVCDRKKENGVRKMEQTVFIEQVKKNLKSNAFFLNCKIPMGYTAGFPILQVRNGSLCVTFPYLRYKTTGVVDKTLVYPIRYMITMELPTEKIVLFEDLEYNEKFRNIDFRKPVGYFRHEEIRQYNKARYKALYDELMQEYDKVINSLIYCTDYSAEDEKRMKELLQLLVEPSLLAMYKALDNDFYNKYLAKG